MPSRPGKGPKVLSPLLDLRWLIPNFDMDQVNKKLMPRTRSDFCANVSSLEFTSNPSHGKSIIGYVFPDIMVSPLNVPSVFGILVTGSHGNGTFTVKVNSGRR